MSEQISPDQMRQRIQNWLTGAGYQVGTPSDPSSQFHLIASTRMGVVIDILQPKSQNDMIVVGAAYPLSPEQSKRLQEINEKKRDDFLWDFRFSLVQGQFSFGFEPADKALPERVVITDTLWYDGITKNSFMKSFEHVNTGLLFTIWKLGKELGGLSPAGHQIPMYPG